MLTTRESWSKVKTDEVSGEMRRRRERKRKRGKNPSPSALYTFSCRMKRLPVARVITGGRPRSLDFSVSASWKDQPICRQVSEAIIDLSQGFR